MRRLINVFWLSMAALELTGCAPQAPKPQGHVKPTTQRIKEAKPHASDELFAGTTLLELHIQVGASDAQKLRDNPRTYARCAIKERKNGTETTYQGVGVKLKGAAGSYRDFDDRPALTVNVDKFKKKQEFHGLDKFHLNNSVQDESYVNELICSEICRDIGIPAPRVTHARVWINDRDLGVYVLKESFDRTFLQRNFEHADGNFYDGGFVQDIDVDLEKDSGDGPDDHSDLHALRSACEESDPATRWERLGKMLDVDAFLSFMAFELMTCHWDGYTGNKNNYRIYFEPKSGQAHFFPHGMDQMFGDPGFPLLEHPQTIVAAAVMQNSEWRARYRERLKKLLPHFAPADRWLARIDKVNGQLRPYFESLGPEPLQAFDDRTREFKERLVARAANLVEQVAQPDPSPHEFDESNVSQIHDWYGASECDDAQHEELPLPEDKRNFSIATGPSGRCIASWRSRLLLANGRYRLTAKAKLENVQRLEGDDRGIGVGIRISGSGRENQLLGTTDWTDLSFEFDVLEDARSVEFVAEIRAAGGKVVFEGDSFRIQRITAKE